jgi:DNA polymerase
MTPRVRERRLRVDVETFSSVDLLKCGHHAYVRSPDFQIMLLGYAWDDEAPVLLDLLAGDQIPADVAMAICEGRDTHGSPVICKAWHASFELSCFSVHFKRRISTSHWRCTMVHAMYCGLPAGLLKACGALGLPADIGKANTGRALIRYFCIPCKPTKANGFRTRNLPEHHPEKWALFKGYCAQDVVAEGGVGDRIAKIEFPAIEQRAWEMDQAINERGILIDQELARAAVDKGKIHRDRLLVEAARITGLSNPNSVKQLKEWLLAVEDDVEDETSDGEWARLINAKLDKKTLIKLLAGLKNVLFGGDGFDEEELDEFELDEAKSVLAKMEQRAAVDPHLGDEFFRRMRLVKAVRVLQLRQEIGKASVKKYDAMLRAVCPDGRVRGVHSFYGANRTGRWAGKIVQTQNMRSNSMANLDVAREAIKRWTIEQAEFWFGNYSELLSQCVRTAIVAPPGRTFVVVDFAAIEAAKLAWLANEEWRLDVFRTHGKIYEMSASLSFGVPFQEFIDHKARTGKHHPLRKKGKVTELACGYGGSVNGMINMGALDEGLQLEELQPMVDAWRAKSPSVVEMWYAVDRAFKRVIGTHNPVPLPQYKITIFWEHGSVFIRLPSGRLLCYLGATVEDGDIVFWGVDQKTKQWSRQRTYGARLVENIDQASSRDCLRDLMLAIENDLMDPWGDIVMHVHDEVVMEVDVAFAERLMQATLAKMRRPYEWAPGLPLKGAGDIMPFYCKAD